MTTTTVRPDVKARALKYDLCGLCTMPRSDRHHDPRFKMHRTPYDVPGHAFSDPALLVVDPPTRVYLFGIGSPAWCLSTGHTINDRGVPVPTRKPR